VTARAKYLERADECMAMAKTANDRDQRLLLGIAEAWLKLAEASLAEEKLRERQETSVLHADFKERIQRGNQ
jgi:Tfp pilus assembly protein PilX